jgi:pyridoxamine 5'-phosphate oxidase
VDPALLAAMRRNYSEHGLDESEVADDPFVQFGRWLSDVVRLDLPEPNAMVLATAAAGDCQPSSRMVLLKGYDSRGFVFHTNYTSRKGRELAGNPRASLLFPWHPIGRQVVVVGSAERLAEPESAAYFRARPRDSQLAAWTSRQSTVIPGRAVLEARYRELADRYPEGADVPAPGFWGGIRVAPETIEFWQGRPHRLHDRLLFRRQSDGWALERLSP